MHCIVGQKITVLNGLCFSSSTLLHDYRHTPHFEGAFQLPKKFKKCKQKTYHIFQFIHREFDFIQYSLVLMLWLHNSDLFWQFMEVVQKLETCTVDDLEQTFNDQGLSDYLVVYLRYGSINLYAFEILYGIVIIFVRGGQCS